MKFIQALGFAFGALLACSILILVIQAIAEVLNV